jgi:hypothetical protein
MNGILALIPDFLRAVQSIVPLFVNSANAAGAIQGALATGAALVEAGEASLPEFKALTVHIQSMSARGEDPTEADWGALKDRSDAAHATIQGSPPVI